MFKKVALYGLTFGSAASAMHLIYFINRLYKTGGIAAALPVFGDVVFTGLAVYFLIKSMMRDAKTPPNMGKVLFASLLTSLLVALCTVASMQHIVRNKTDRITEFKTLSMENQTRLIEAQTPKAEWPAKKLEVAQLIEKRLDLTVFTVSQVQQCLLTGFVLALLIFAISIRKN